MTFSGVCRTRSKQQEHFRNPLWRLDRAARGRTCNWLTMRCSCFLDGFTWKFYQGGWQENYRKCPKQHLGTLAFSHAARIEGCDAPLFVSRDCVDNNCGGKKRAVPAKSDSHQPIYPKAQWVHCLNAFEASNSQTRSFLCLDHLSIYMYN